VIFRVRRLRQAARGCTWREVELHSTEPLVAYEAHETHWFKFAEPVPRRFRAAISSHGSPDCDRHRWFAVRPTETDRVLLARIRRSKPQARPEPVRSELGSPRWRADDVGSVGCRLTSAGIERATSDAADSLFATVVLHRALSDAQLDVWQPRGPRLGHVEETDRGLELKNTAGQLVVELERRFGEAAFLHRGVRVGSRNGSDLRVAGHLLQSRRWRRISRLSGSLYCVLDADGELKAAARQRGWGDAVTVQLAPELEPVAAAVVLLQVAERFINRR
jgi:hypothetical protein